MNVVEQNISLCTKEGFEVKKTGEKYDVIIYGEKFPLVHPLSIHLKLYRTQKDPGIKYTHLKAAHDLLWPELSKTWNYWDEDRFRAHVDGYNYIVLAGGASTGKSHCCARIACLFWLADPRHRAAVVASTTLTSMGKRIMGYVTRLLMNTAIPIQFNYKRSPKPQFLYDRNDTIHGIFAEAAKLGDDDRVIKDIIGHHPERELMIVMDEAPDMMIALLKAFTNLDTGAKPFQCIALGNSKSRFDLHGSMATPKEGWGSVNPMRDTKWETCQPNGICLFFSCYNSPAIHEKDPVKKAALETFLITKEQIEKNKLNQTPEMFWRMTLGFWQSDTEDTVVISEKFINEFGIRGKAEWSGLSSLRIVGGLDPAFSTGGDQCILRLGILGQDIFGNVVLDFREEELMFRIKIDPRANKSAEFQIADRVEEILKEYGCGLGDICIDANGQGRALGSVIQLRMKSMESPVKIYSTRAGYKGVNSFDVTIKNTMELWTDMRKFIETNQIKGLDYTSIMQFTSRQVARSDKTGKLVLESKADFKARMNASNPGLAHSPDEADSAALCLQAAILRGGFSPGMRKEVSSVANDGFQMRKYEAYVLGKRLEGETSEGTGGAPEANFNTRLEDFEEKA